MTSREQARKSVEKLAAADLAALRGRSMLLTSEWSSEDIETLLDVGEAFQALDQASIATPLFPNEFDYAPFFDASTRTKLVADAIIGRVKEGAKVESGVSRSAQENEGTDGGAARGADEGADGSGNGHGDAFDLQQLMLRRAHRDWRVPVSHTALDDRMNFNEPIQTYTEEEAMAEASRCLDCHEICSLCVGVCPNMALMTYESKPFTVVLPTLVVANGTVVVSETGKPGETAGTSEFKADQCHQIAVLTDFCNECGNCTTFCPTSGEPYRDKARLYLNREDFEAEKDNAFMLIRDSETPGTDAIEARWNGETHRLEINGDLRYTSPDFSAQLKAEDFSLLTAQRATE